MNTPPKVRRHDPTKVMEQLVGEHIRAAPYAISLSNPDFAICLASIVSEFVHLETKMAEVLAVLLGSKDRFPAGYVWRSIQSPRGRIEMMKSLLQEAPHNRKMTNVWDVILTDFDSINGRRNDYVHGQWFTNTEDGSVLLAKLRADPHGIGWYAAAPIELAEMEATLDDIRQLKRLVGQTVVMHRFSKRRPKRPPPENAPSAPNDGGPRSGSKRPPPRRRS